MEWLIPLSVIFSFISVVLTVAIAMRIAKLKFLYIGFLIASLFSFLTYFLFNLMIFIVLGELLLVVNLSIVLYDSGTSYFFYERKYKEIKSMIEVLKEMLLRREITEEEFSKLKTEFVKEIVKIEAKLKEIS
ncbi:MAG: hypothetical protein QW641_02160 [Candidatus Aenigmatarchaeota archaeon]